MQVDQAIFTSIQAGRVQGYQLAARSRGIDDQVAKTLTRWGPSHASLCDRDPSAESLNFHCITDDQFALSRTICGGPEYSGRGGFQLFTRFLALERDTIADFEFNPVALFRRARQEGVWQLTPRFDSWLDKQTLPKPAPATFWRPRETTAPDEFVHEVVQRLQNRERLAVINCLRPLGLLQRILWATPQADRLEISFTTGLKPTANRPFQLHFVPGDSSELQRSASALGIQCLSATG